MRGFNAKTLLLAALFFFSMDLSASADFEHNVIRRVTVFPFQVPQSLSDKADQAWWKVREILTSNQRFLVASRHFMVQKDVLQARSTLSPADVILLGKLLDTHAMISTYLRGRQLTMKVYDAEFGRLIWEQEITLQPSLPLSDQIIPVAEKLVYDFISSFPYQGFVIIDPLKGKVLYQEANESLVKVEVFGDFDLEVGDKVQFVRLVSDNMKALFKEGGSTEIFAEGIVKEIDRDHIEVIVQRATDVTEILDKTLVRIPRELRRLKDNYALASQIKSGIDPRLLSPQMSPIQEEIEETKPLITSITFIGNLALFLLFAL